MPIALTCRCGKQLQVGEIHAGKQGRCPSCEAILEIPAASTVPALPNLSPGDPGRAKPPAAAAHPAPPSSEPALRDEALVPP